MRRIILTLVDQVQPLDIVGPHEVFSAANDAMDHLDRHGDRYELTLAAHTLRPVTSHSGLSIMPTARFEDLDGSFDTVLVPGADNIAGSARDERLVAWLRDAKPRSRRLASVCTGTFLLAAAGHCDGRRVTTHWAWAPKLAEQFPAVTVDPDPIFIQDDWLWSSAGVTAGIDLALALVEDDCGAEVAQIIARHLVVYLRRPGGQSQFGAPVWTEASEVEPIRSARDHIHQHPDADLGVDALAEHVGLSSRHFTRLFRAEVGESPARYVERVRVEAARSILERESVGLDGTARRCGFANTETLRRAFHRQLGISPATYRRQHGVVHQPSTTNS